MDTSEHTIAAGEFKTKCLGIMESIHETGLPVVITKRGVPMVKIIPYVEKEKPKKSLFAAMQGTITINADIIEPIGEPWEADE